MKAKLKRSIKPGLEEGMKRVGSLKVYATKEELEAGGRRLPPHVER